VFSGALACTSRAHLPRPTMSTVAEGRAKRAIAPNAKQNALARLADLKKNGGRRTDQYQVCLRSGRSHTRRNRIRRASGPFRSLWTLARAPTSCPLSMLPLTTSDAT
jgi:hypothetical protein